MTPVPVVGVGAMIFDAGGRVLLVERGHPPAAGRWSVPGGKLEPGETLAQGVAREVREETGLVVEVGALACVVEAITDAYHYVILDHHARVIGGALAAATDARSARWVALDELDSLPLTDGLSGAVRQAHATHAPWSTSP
ncbi:MAG TPA: NUDIX hydrolase [Kofleriaceae bacterium]